MKILIVCTRLSFGGAERVAVMWANGFVEKGHEVMVVSNLFDPITYQIDRRVLVRNLVSDNQRKLKKWGSAIGNVRKAVKEFQPNVVIGVMSTCSIIARMATMGNGIPVIATEHNSFERPSSAPLSRWEKFTKFFLNRVYSHVTVLTEVDRQYIGTRLKNVEVMPNPLALQPVEVIPEKKKVLLAAGRLDVWYTKGFDLLIKAWGLIKGENAAGQREKCKSKTSVACKMKDEGWRLQIAGTGSEESLEYLKQLCKENGVENSVDFLGFRTDIEELYKQSEIFVLSSRYEGFGLVLIEAMSQGCACVACDYEGRQREIIQDDSQGLCCEPDNVEALASAMKKMIEDDRYRESIRPHAIERSKDYSIDHIIDKWESLFQQLSIQ